MTYFPALRRQYILWRLATVGEVQRADIMRTFGVSMAQASGDINALIADDPAATSYDKTRKRYIGKRYRPAERIAQIAAALDWI